MMTSVATPACHDCGRRYGEQYGFPDLVIAHSIWKLISPTNDEGSLLCPSCMCKRGYDAKLSGIPATFRSGPFAIYHSERSSDGDESGS